MKVAVYQIFVKVFSVSQKTYFSLLKSKEELKRTRREIVRSSKSPKAALAAQTVLRRVTNERDDALSELDVTRADRDNLRERLKVTPKHYFL